MKLIVQKIIAEFNKIYHGDKRIGDSLRVNGKLESELDVFNASKLGYKTESQLSVSKSVNTQMSEKLRAYNTNGDAIVDTFGNYIYHTEEQLSVLNARKLCNVDPINLEVDIARRIKVSDSVILTVASIFDNPALYRVKDSALLGGKTEATLSVSYANDAGNTTLVNNKPESNLSVLNSRFLDNKAEADLDVRSTKYVTLAGVNYDLSQIKTYVVSSTEATTIITGRSLTADRFTTARTLALSNDVSGSATIDGSSNITLAVTLANTGISAGTIGNSENTIQPFIVDAKGRITGLGVSKEIKPLFTNIQNRPDTLSGYGIIDASKSDHVHDELYQPKGDYASSAHSHQLIITDDNGVELENGLLLDIVTKMYNEIAALKSEVETLKSQITI